MFKHTITVPVPTQTSPVGPVPTVTPTDAPVLQHIHATGQRTLWVVTVLMGISSLCFYSLAARVAKEKRLLHVFVATITTISFLVYLAMSTGQGITWRDIFIHEKHKHVPDTYQQISRQIFWAQYLKWILTTPLQVLNIAFIGSLPGANLFVAIVADLILYVAAYVGIFAIHGRRWVWYAISCVAFLVLVYQIGFNGNRAVRRRSNQTQTFYSAFVTAKLLAVVLLLIAVASSPLARKISVDAEIILFAIVDVLTQGVMGFWLIVGHDSSEAQISIDGFWANGYSPEGTIRVGDSEGA
ncbi:hypothetical protein VTN49DRAFT_1919 [Thermomyces lanuginosus]|uniref:uncharacterized protein n=1 Tax=Thermomyces lanuginosus TaxID=5541 RepID=UPI003743847C